MKTRYFFIFAASLLATSPLYSAETETPATVDNPSAEPAEAVMTAESVAAQPVEAVAVTTQEVAVLPVATPAPQAVAAQPEPEKKKFKVEPSGRILFDGATYITRDKTFATGVAIPDVRIGAKMTYGMFTAKIDIGYQYGKVNLKDIFVQMDFNPSMLLRIGSFIHQFGLQSATSSSMKESFEEPSSNEIFNFGRQLGAMFIYDKGQYFGTASVHAEGSEPMTMTANQLKRMRFGFMTRQLWRPFTAPGRILQVGISGAYDNPDADNNMSLNGNFPTRVNKVSAVGMTVANVKHEYRLTPELLAAYGPVALETQYYWLHATRRDKSQPGFTGYGAYGLVRALALGGDYNYSHADGGLATPNPKSLEFVLMYNYSNLCDAEADVFGGRINTISFNANYYINKYMLVRLGYNFSHVWDRRDYAPVNLGVFQVRFQVKF